MLKIVITFCWVLYFNKNTLDYDTDKLNLFPKRYIIPYMIFLHSNTFNFKTHLHASCLSLTFNIFQNREFNVSSILSVNQPNNLSSFTLLFLTFSSFLHLFASVSLFIIVINLYFRHFLYIHLSLNSSILIGTSWHENQHSTLYYFSWSRKRNSITRVNGYLFLLTSFLSFP